MSSVGLVGDLTTTTTVALATSWPAHDDVVVVEADPSGGNLAGWFDVPLSPSLSTLVAATHSHPAAQVPTELIRRVESGLAFVPAPFRAREASRAVAEAARGLVPHLAAGPHRVLLVDMGRPEADTVDGRPFRSDLTIVCHRQDPSSPGAAAARLERLHELVENVSADGGPLVIAIIGDRPFETSEITDHVGQGNRCVAIADDPLAAAALAGRRGVSHRRLQRLPLLRTSRRLADVVRAELVAHELLVEPAEIDDLGAPADRDRDPSTNSGSR